MTLARNRLALIGLLICLEVGALAATYQIFASLECRATGAELLCDAFSSLVARAVAVLAVFLVTLWARPAATQALRVAVEGGVARGVWPWVHVAGVAALFWPAVAFGGADSAAFFAAAAGPWLIGVAAASFGALFWLAPPAAWTAWLRAVGPVPAAALLVAFALPDLGALVQPLWAVSALSRQTFLAVAWLLYLLGQNPVVDVDARLIGVRDFLVEVGEPCSGVEGFALIVGFAVIYAALFRDRLRFPLYWIVVLPVAVALSWTLNVLRIAALVAIGAHVSPELAANGFHSYAGWMTFTLLALGLLWAVERARFLQRDPDLPAPPAPPLAQDWVAARIAPFAVFMLSGVVLALAHTTPDVGYPVKALATLAALAVFWRLYLRLDWRPEVGAIAAGLAVGVAWLATDPPAGAPDADLAAALAGLGPVAFALWATARVLGTAVLVPMVEELFFRGYVLARIDDGGGIARRLIALAVSSALFALLHDRWIAAGLAGLVFGLVYLRRGRLADAVYAHAAANATIAGWALATGDWAAI